MNRQIEENKPEVKQVHCKLYSTVPESELVMIKMGKWRLFPGGARYKKNRISTILNGVKKANFKQKIR